MMTVNTKGGLRIHGHGHKIVNTIIYLQGGVHAHVLESHRMVMERIHLGRASGEVNPFMDVTLNNGKLITLDATQVIGIEEVN